MATRPVFDKAEAKRGSQSLHEVRQKVKARIVSKGIQDKDVWTSKREKDAPALPNEAMNLLLITAVTWGMSLSKATWRQPLFNSPLARRVVYLRIPPSGLPAYD